MTLWALLGFCRVFVGWVSDIPSWLTGMMQVCSLEAGSRFWPRSAGHQGKAGGDAFLGAPQATFWRKEGQNWSFSFDKSEAMAVVALRSGRGDSFHQA